MNKREAMEEILALVITLDDALQGVNSGDPVNVIDPRVLVPQITGCAAGCQDLRAFLTQELEQPIGVWQ